MSLEELGRQLLHEIEDLDRPGTRETPDRFAKAIRELTRGYDVRVGDLFRAFEDGAEGCDQLIFVRDIPVWSLCEHHLLPFFGVAHIGYLPNKRVLGLSKFGRIVDAFSRRLQVQERLTNQIADAITEHLKPRGLGVILRCRHLCMEMRGARQNGSQTITSALRGDVREEAACRAEFLHMVGQGAY